MTFCKYCGCQLEDGAMFCVSCGQSQADAAPAAPQAPVAPQPPVFNQAPVYGAPQAPMYAPQAPYMAPQQDDSLPGKGLGIASMILGILSICLCCLWYLAIPCGIIGLIMGAIATSKAKQVGRKNGFGVAGLVCSCISVGFAVLFVVALSAFFAELGLWAAL